ncbi:MAG: winged helix-turn-helix domain-containing protein [Candidatus ainarchaeum sp.]|nr:winged helix-turn-helix domain-containing protein [Candidatus ainarchaeum sp.]
MNRSHVMLAALLLAGAAFACVTAPVITVGEKNFSAATEWFGGAALTIQELDSRMAARYGSAWTGLNLTDSEKSAVAGFVSIGYSANRMTPHEYESFLASAQATNANPDDCSYYGAVAYNNGFAGYLLDASSDKTQACAELPKPRCASAAAYANAPNDLAGGAQESASQDKDAPSGEGTLAAGPAAPAPGGTPAQDAGIAGFLSGAVPLALLGAVLAAFVVFTVMARRPGSAFDLEDDTDMHRALSSSTRMDLMRELVQRDLTPTDLSARVGKSKATVVEHLDRLIDAKLVEKIEREGKKYVFYRATPKGRLLVRRAA